MPPAGMFIADKTDMGQVGTVIVVAAEDLVRS